MNAKFKRTLEDGRVAPDSNEEYLLYQTIAGAWPWHIKSMDEKENFLERIRQYASKALSEAKVNLSWINPDPVYMEAVSGFINAVLEPGPTGKMSPFLRSLNELMPELRVFGAVNSLAQVVLKVASPGVPDFYQGTELWELTLVDPDNRRPVEYQVRANYLDSMIVQSQQEGLDAVCRHVLAHLGDGRAKLWTTHVALKLRAKEIALFRRGQYVPLIASAPYQEHAIAFLRIDTASGRSVLAVVPRFACTLMHGKAQLPLGAAWGKARLTLPESGPSRFVNAFTGEVVSLEQDRGIALSTVFETYPVALLVSED
jgi:(1->4)-alpha-D-glucan 1-alpha-D-glucosylmutase